MCRDECIYEYQATDRSLKHQLRGSIRAKSELDASMKLDLLGMSASYLWPKGKIRDLIHQRFTWTHSFSLVGAWVRSAMAPGTLTLNRSRARQYLLTAAVFAAAVAAYARTLSRGETSGLGLFLLIVGGLLLLYCFYSESIVCTRDPRRVTITRNWLWRKGERKLDCDEIECLRVSLKTYIVGLDREADAVYVTSVVFHDGYEYPIAISRSSRGAEREVAKVLSEFWDVPYTVVPRDEAE